MKRKVKRSEEWAKLRKKYTSWQLFWGILWFPFWWMIQFFLKVSFFTVDKMYYCLCWIDSKI